MRRLFVFTAAITVCASAVAQFDIVDPSGKKVGGKNVSAHVVATVEGSDTTKVYFTSRGELLKLESKQFNLVKK